MLEESGDFYQAKNALNPDEYTIYYQGKQWEVYIPKTQRAASYLGVGTNWCTTWGEYCLNPEYKTSTNQFESYNRRDKLYIVVNKQDPQKKYQFHFQSKSFMNKHDNPINLKDFFTNHEELISVFYPSLYDEVSEQEFAQDLKRIQYLPDIFQEKLIGRLVQGSDNPVVNAIVHQQAGPVALFFGLVEADHSDDERWDNSNYVEYGDTTLQLNLDKIGSVIEDLDRAYSTAASQYGWEVNASEHFYGSDIIKEQFEKDLEQFLKDHETDLKEKFGVHLQDLMNREELYEKYEEKYYSDFYYNATEAVQNAQRDAEKEFEDTVYAQEAYGGYRYRNDHKYELIFNKYTLIRYLMQQGITKPVEDVDDFVDDFMRTMNVPNQDSVYEAMMEAEGAADYPTYKDLEGVFEDYFEDLDADPKIVELKKALQEFIDRYKLGDSYEYHKGDIMLKLYPKDINVDTESVRVWYINRATGVDEIGYIKIENLPRYITNYSLFEIFFGK
jgi:hypothetical protein